MAAGGPGNQPPSTLFQARLDTTDGVSNTLTLKQYAGNKVVVAGLSVSVPSGGLTRLVGDNLITAAGADSGAPGVASTLYYVYISNARAAFSPSSIRLSVTPPSIVNGVKYLGGSGAALNWRFVGWVKLNATPQFESSKTSRFIMNYYNRLALAMYVNPGYVNDNAQTSYAAVSASYVTLASIVGSGTSKLSFISNGEDAVVYDADYLLLVGPTVLSLGFFGIGEDSQTQPAAAGLVQVNAASANLVMPVGKATLFSEGAHTLDMLIALNFGNVSFIADIGRPAGEAADSPGTELSAIIYG